MRVIDSSVLVKYFTREKGWLEARKYIIEGAITLDLALKELANALWKKNVQKTIDKELVKKIINDILQEKPFIIVNEQKYIQDALDISLQYNITIYDALFIALAHKLGLELVTADHKQAEAASKQGVKAILIA